MITGSKQRTLCGILVVGVYVEDSKQREQYSNLQSVCHTQSMFSGSEASCSYWKNFTSYWKIIKLDDRISILPCIKEGKRLLHSIVQPLQEGQKRKMYAREEEKRTSKNVSQRSKRYSVQHSLSGSRFRRPTNLINSGFMV